jgi:DNA-binding GntR family transcriptional regulator
MIYRQPLLNRQDIPTEIAAHLRTQILSGELKPGSPLRQADLALKFGTSRIPLREALRQLEAEGLVQFETNKGAIVAPISLDDLEELFEMRVLLEPHILGQAIPKHTPETWKQAEETNTLMKAGTKETPWGDLNWEFHRILYTPSGRRKLLTTIENLRLQSERFSSLIRQSDYKQRAQTEHKEILEACKKRNIEDAQERLRKHIVHSGSELVRVLKTLT